MKNKIIWLSPIFFLIFVINVQSQFPIKITGNPVVDYIITDEILNGSDDDDTTSAEPKYGRHDVPDMKKMRGFPGIGTTTEIFKPISFEEPQEKSNKGLYAVICIAFFVVFMASIFFYILRD